MNMDWYVYLNGESQGPYSKKYLQEMVAQGDLKEEDYVCLAGTPRWIRAREVEGLFAPSSSPWPGPPPPPRPGTAGSPPPISSPQGPEGASTPSGPPPPPRVPGASPGSPAGPTGSQGPPPPPPPPVAKGPSSHPSQFPGGGQGVPGGQIPGKGSNTILKVSVLLAGLIIVFGGLFAGGWWMWNSFLGGEGFDEASLEDSLGVMEMEEEEEGPVEAVLEEKPAVDVEDFASDPTDGPVERALHNYIMDVYKTDEYKLFTLEVMEKGEEDFLERYQGQLVFVYSYDYVGDYVEAVLDDPFSDYAFGLILEQEREGWIASRYIEL